MPVYNLVGGVEVEYGIGAGQPIVKLRSTGGIRHRAVYTGTGVLLFHWVQEGKTQAWKCDSSMLDPQTIQPVEATDSDGSQTLTFTLQESMPAAGLLRRRWEGTLLAPAIHIDVPMGRDIWIFLIRSPWFSMKPSVSKQLLSIAHDQSTANASVSIDPAGGLSAAVSNTGTSFRKVSLVMSRKVGEFVSEEMIGEVSSGTVNFSWRPIMRSFDLCLATMSSVSMGQLAGIAQGLGAQFSSGFFGPGSLLGDYLLCDGPRTGYFLSLKGDLGFLRHEEDSTQASLSW